MSCPDFDFLGLKFSVKIRESPKFFKHFFQIFHPVPFMKKLIFFLWETNAN